MMNFFNQELRKLTKGAGFASGNVKVLDRTAFVKMSDDRRARVEFVTLGVADNYTAVRVTILNKKEGEVDCQLLRFADYFTKNARGQRPHIWVYGDKVEWYAQPAAAEWIALAKAVGDYVSVFE